jgi:hypothetical protein
MNIPPNAYSLDYMPPKPKSNPSHPSHLSYRRTQSYIANLFSFLTAHPFIAMTRMIHAIRKVMTPIETVNINIASKSWSSRVFIVSCAWIIYHQSAFQGFVFWKWESGTYTSHENHPSSHQAERRNQLGGRSTRENRLRWREVKHNVGSSTCECGSNE